jgi:tetraacyldisaccharide 4'-kinase
MNPSRLAAAFFFSPWSKLLTPLARVYAAAARLRRRRWEGKARRLPVPVVSVGNVTVGGTGKTPVVELIVRRLIERGRRPAILSRGYGRGLPAAAAAGAEVVNDEFLVLRERLPGVLHLQDPDRFRAGEKAAALGADIIVLDDGFQHFQLHRDLDLVLIDAINPFGFGSVLPAGLLREPLEALARADALILTRGGLVQPLKRSILMSYLRRRFPRPALAEVEFRPAAWRSLDGAVSEPPQAYRGARALAFAGIGNPEGFRRQVEALGLEIAKWIPFLDHHLYTRADVEAIQRAAERAGAGVVALTQKDAVKIPSMGAAVRPPWRYLEIEPALASDGRLAAMLDALAAAVAGRNEGR